MLVSMSHVFKDTYLHVFSHTNVQLSDIYILLYIVHKLQGKSKKYMLSKSPLCEAETGK